MKGFNALFFFIMLLIKVDMQIAKKRDSLTTQKRVSEVRL